MILERSEFEFLQATCDGSGFLVERRLSQAEGLQYARHAGYHSSVLDAQDAYAIMSWYISGVDEIAGVEWVD